MKINLSQFGYLAIILIAMFIILKFIVSIFTDIIIITALLIAVSFYIRNFRKNK